MDLEGYRRASREVWTAMAPGWDRRSVFFERMARPVAGRMLEELAPRPGDTVLDVAAGAGAMGLAAAAVVGGRGRVIVTDFSGAMVDAARGNAARLGLGNVECRVLPRMTPRPDATLTSVKVPLPLFRQSVFLPLSSGWLGTGLLLQLTKRSSSPSLS